MSDAGYRPSPEPADVEVDAIEVVEPGAAPAPKTRLSWSPELRFMLVSGLALIVLFLAFILLIAFRPTGEAVIALAVVVAAIAAIVVVHSTITFAIRQLADSRTTAVAAEDRARAAESALRESDSWAAQMESGLRVAVAKLRTAKLDTADVERAAGTPDDFF